jgi:hypothetical protein
MGRKTFNKGLRGFRMVLSVQISESPGVISMTSNVLEIKAKAKKKSD